VVLLLYNVLGIRSKILTFKLIIIEISPLRGIQGVKKGHLILPLFILNLNLKPNYKYIERCLV